LSRLRRFFTGTLSLKPLVFPITSGIDRQTTTEPLRGCGTKHHARKGRAQQMENQNRLAEENRKLCASPDATCRPYYLNLDAF
jgi:hypothetical protein